MSLAAYRKRTISAEYLRALRNDLPVVIVISDLAIPTQKRGKRLTFRCPECGGFHTATKSDTNLARCFRCKRNFNPIDLAMAERHSGFLEAVRYLQALSINCQIPLRQRVNRYCEDAAPIQRGGIPQLPNAQQQLLPETPGITAPQAATGSASGTDRANGPRPPSRSRPLARLVPAMRYQRSRNESLDPTGERSGRGRPGIEKKGGS